MREIRSVARKVRVLRSVNEMSIAELSDLSGISPRTINRVESGDTVGYNPHIKTVGSLARVFGLSLAALLETPVEQLRNVLRG